MSCVACTAGIGISIGTGTGTGGSFPGSGDAFTRSAFVYSIVEDSGSVKVVLRIRCQSAINLNISRKCALTPFIIEH